MVKKIIFLLALTFAALDADAQFFTGLAFDVNWHNEGSSSNNTDKISLNSYGGVISPQFGYKFSPKFMVGARLNFVFDKSYTSESDEKTKEIKKYLYSSIGWDVAPFARYRIAKFGENDWFSVWADIHAYYGISYPNKVQEQGYITVDFNKKHLYGIQAMPTLGFQFNETTTLFLNVAILSFAYSGTCTEYKDRYDFNNKVILFTGKLSGLFSTLSDDGMYGLKLGIVRTF